MSDQPMNLGAAMMYQYSYSGKINIQNIIINQPNALEACVLNYHDADLEYDLQHIALLNQ